MNQREIKFRAWDKVAKEMRYSISLIDLGSMFQTVYVAQNDFELMQFTGLKDKNDKEIYEGDIVEDLRHLTAIHRGQEDWDEKVIYLVEWSIDDDPISGKTGFNLGESDYVEREVIGNIYENPELLKP